MGVIVVQLQAVHLVVNVAAQLPHDIGRDSGHVETLQEGEELGYEIKAYQCPQQP